MAEKKSKGRQKIEIKIIKDELYRLVTFSKRRSGIYKKANELSILCDVDIAIIFFSPSGNPYTFATSSIQNVVNKTLPPNDDANHLFEARRNLRIDELSKRYNDLAMQLEAENKQENLLNHMNRARQTKGWWEESIDELNQPKLEQMSKSIKYLQKEISSTCDELNSSFSTK